LEPSLESFGQAGHVEVGGSEERMRPLDSVR
jgi:hypothetical protein